MPDTRSSKSHQQSPTEWRRRDEIARENLMRRLSETGEKERIMRSLRSKLIECGWRDEMKDLSKDAIRNRGLTKITVDELVSEILPRGRAAVPEDVKRFLLEGVRDFVKRDGVGSGGRQGGGAAEF
mmetsp:Transcript_30693/g.37490  ORF Transcript_30693/g.37490 Transcript_30693/m.37490 type:complete len:126 (+) Transcript_30693:58-435(+)